MAARNTRIKERTTSNFRVDPNNILGREQKSGRNSLYAKAVINPSGYLMMREHAMEKVIDDLNIEMYDRFWNLLTVGKDHKGDQLLKMPSGAGELPGGDFHPGLPESTVSKFCLKVAEAIEEITEEAFEMVMPMDHKDLAVRKLNFDAERAV